METDVEVGGFRRKKGFKKQRSYGAIWRKLPFSMLSSFTSSGRSRRGSFVADRIADFLAVGANGLGSLSHGSWSSKSLRSFTSPWRSRRGSFVAGRIADILAVGANGLGSLSHGSWSSNCVPSRDLGVQDVEVLLPTGLLTFWPLARMVLEVFPTAVGLQSRCVPSRALGVQDVEVLLPTGLLTCWPLARMVLEVFPTA